jgi:hypothetical protein
MAVLAPYSTADTGNSQVQLAIKEGLSAEHAKLRSGLELSTTSPAPCPDLLLVSRLCLLTLYTWTSCDGFMVLWCTLFLLLTCFYDVARFCVCCCQWCCLAQLVFTAMSHNLTRHKNRIHLSIALEQGVPRYYLLPTTLFP